MEDDFSEILELKASPVEVQKEKKEREKNQIIPKNEKALRLLCMPVQNVTKHNASQWKVRHAFMLQMPFE